MPQQRHGHDQQDDKYIYNLFSERWNNDMIYLAGIFYHIFSLSQVFAYAVPLFLILISEGLPFWILEITSSQKHHYGGTDEASHWCFIITEYQ